MAENSSDGAFTLFSSLPPELQYMVWIWALPDGRYLSIDRCEEQLGHNRYAITANQQRREGIERACKMSREVFLKNYDSVDNLVSSHEQEEAEHSRIRPLYINFSVDTIMIGRWNFPLGLDIILGLLGHAKDKIQRLAIHQEYFSNEKLRLVKAARAIQQLPKLTDLEVVIRTHDEAEGEQHFPDSMAAVPLTIVTHEGLKGSETVQSLVMQKLASQWKLYQTESGGDRGYITSLTTLYFEILSRRRIMCKLVRRQADQSQEWRDRSREDERIQGVGIEGRRRIRFFQELSLGDFRV